LFSNTRSRTGTNCIINGDCINVSKILQFLTICLFSYGITIHLQVDDGMLCYVAATASGSSSSNPSNTLPRSSIPRSNNSYRRRYFSSLSGDSSQSSSSTDGSSSLSPLLTPPWNPSPNIDPYGFLHGTYVRQPGEWEKEVWFRGSTASSSSSNSNLNIPCRVRQVPGDGNCLFHSISLCLYHAVNGTHWDITGTSGTDHCNHDEQLSSLRTSRFSSKGTSSDSHRRNTAYEELYYQSYQLRKAAVECLSQSIPSYNPQGNTLNSFRGGDRVAVATGADDNDADDEDNKKSSRRNNRRKSINTKQQYVQPPKKKKNHLLYLQGREFLRTSELVQAASQQYGITPEEYCSSMEQESVWGGGPEIVALCNVLKRPIHVYELATTTTRTTNDETESDDTNEYYGGEGAGGGKKIFVLRRMACFGSPRFDKNEALHILSADSRFPDIQPGQQLAAGNHFLAVFPIKEQSEHGHYPRGSNNNNGNRHDHSVSSNIKKQLPTTVTKRYGWFTYIANRLHNNNNNDVNDKADEEFMNIKMHKPNDNKASKRSTTKIRGGMILLSSTRRSFENMVINVILAWLMTIMITMSSNCT
jgi:OTU-like cysteine protease